MTAERQKEIETAIIRVMSGLLAPIDRSKTFQSISFVGLHQMLLSIPRSEFVEALKNIEGIQISESREIEIPTSYFLSNDKNE